MRVRRGTVAALLAAAACGGVDLPPLEVRDPGDGTGALLVQAYVKGEATVPNAADPAAFRTRMVVRVLRRGQPVSGAAVRVNGVPLAPAGFGTYVEASQLRGLPPPVVSLEVVAGPDAVRGACSSPGGHAFTRPSGGGDVLVLGADAPVDVAWVRTRRADSASLNVGGFAAVGNIDDGAFEVAPGAPGLRPAAPAPVGLWRENRVLLRGGTTGSLLSVSVWNGLEVTLQAR